MHVFVIFRAGFEKVFMYATEVEIILPILQLKLHL